MHGQAEKCIQVLMGKPEGRRLLGMARCRWEGNNKMDFKEIEW
jgi:hypothetical protein